MLFIRRHFTLKVRLTDWHVIQEKLKEFNIDIYRSEFKRTQLGDIGELESVFIECTENENKIDALVNYLKDEFTGIASITF